MGLNFNNTCPAIDKALEGVKSDIEAYFDKAVELVEDEEFITLSKDTQSGIAELVDNLYSEVENAFNAVRETNSDMRSVADDQLKELENQLIDKEELIDDLESRIEELNDELSNMADRIAF